MHDPCESPHGEPSGQGGPARSARDGLVVKFRISFAGTLALFWLLQLFFLVTENQGIHLNALWSSLVLALVGGVVGMVLPTRRRWVYAPIAAVGVHLLIIAIGQVVE